MNDAVNNQHIESNRCIHGFYVDACLLCPSSVVTMTKAREAFEQFIKNSPNYNKLVLIHGEHLFIFEDGQYKNLHVQLAWEVWQKKSLMHKPHLDFQSINEAWLNKTEMQG